MARKRDVVVAVIIGGAFLVALGLFAMILITMLSDPGELSFAGLGGNIGLIEVYGPLQESNGRQIVEQLDRWSDNSSIKALVLHVNSPGGGVAISQEIYDAVNRVRDNGKPVVVSMAAVAASGGYYIACAADRIVANPGTITGSIGVIFQFYTGEKLMEKIGLSTETVKSGELKDVGSFGRDMTEEEQLMLRAVVMDSYEQFVEVVATGRGKEKEDVYQVADGSIFTGQQAYNLGLVDTLGGLNEAVWLAAELAEIDGEPSLVRPYKREKVGWADLLGSVAKEVSGAVGQQALGPQLLYIYK